MVFFYLYFFICSFGPVSMSPQHANSWVVEFQSQIIGHIDTILYPSNLLNYIRYILCLRFLHVVSYRSVSYTPLSSSPSTPDISRAIAPDRSIPSCSCHLRATHYPGLHAVSSQSSRIGRIAVYCATVFYLFKM